MTGVNAKELFILEFTSSGDKWTALYAFFRAKDAEKSLATRKRANDGVEYRVSKFTREK